MVPSLLGQTALAVGRCPEAVFQRLELQLDADADLGLLAQACGRRVHPVQLVEGVQVDADAVPDRHLEFLVALVAAVEDQGPGVGAGEESQIELVDAEAVTADAFLVDHVAHG